VSESVLRRSLVLRRLQLTDLPYIASLMEFDEVLGRWRFSHTCPNPQVLPSAIWEGVLTQVIVEDTADRADLGLLICHNASLREGWAYLAALTTRGERPNVRFVGALLQFIDSIFDAWPFRRLYIDSRESAHALINSIESHFAEPVARLPAHRFARGEFEAEVVVLICRDRWNSFRPRGATISKPLDDLCTRFTSTDTLELEQFCELVAAVAGTNSAHDEGGVKPNMILSGLGLDAFTCGLLGMAIEELAGSPGPVSLDIDPAWTVHETYLLYCTCRSTPESGSVILDPAFGGGSFRPPSRS